MTHEAQAGSRMNQILVAVLAGSFLCLVVLIIGMAIGFRLGLPAGPTLCLAGQAPSQGIDQTDLQRLMSAWWDLRVRLTEIAIRVRQMEQLPQDIIAQLQSELNRATENVSESLDQKLVLIEHDTSKAEVTKTARAEPAAEEIGHSELISNEQLLALLSQVGRPGSGQETPVVRHKYAAKQYLAPALDDQPLAAEAFQTVQCHDISVRDIRYFVDDPPISPRVVLGLGVPSPVKWVAAEIEDSRAAYRYGRVGYSGHRPARREHRQPEPGGSGSAEIPRSRHVMGGLETNNASRSHLLFSFGR